MRKDIELNLQYGDLELGGESPPFFVSPTLAKEDDLALYFDCELYGDSKISESKKHGCACVFSQLDTTKILKIQFIYTSDLGVISKGGYKSVKFNEKTVSGCSLPAISIDFKYKLYDTKDCVMIYDMMDYDLSVNKSLDQNQFLLLVNAAGNIYHEPITGVGLKDYLSSDIVSTNLSVKIQEEFLLDGMKVRSASVVPDTGEISIISDEI